MLTQPVWSFIRELNERILGGSSAPLQLLHRFASFLLTCATCWTRNTYLLTAIDQGQRVLRRVIIGSAMLQTHMHFRHTRNEDSATTWIAQRGGAKVQLRGNFPLYFCAILRKKKTQKQTNPYLKDTRSFSRWVQNVLFGAVRPEKKK